MKTYTKLTVIFTCQPLREPIEYVLECTDHSEKTKEDFVKSKVREITSGCNYRYEYVGNKGDYYFFE